MEHDKLPTTEKTRPLPSMEPVHCENCLNWIERYFRDVPYLHVQLNQVVTQNSVLERENDELRACIRSTSHRANKHIKRSKNVVIKNSTNFNTIINSDLFDASLLNL
jgi:regulator of replication initiation timing